MSVVSCDNLRKFYKPGLFQSRVLAVDGLSLSLLEGEVYGLVGPNGAGKSSTIRMILGLSRPSSGSVSFYDDRYCVDSVRKEIGYLPENPYLYDHLKLSELIEFCGKTSGMNRREMIARGKKLIDRLNLVEAQNRPLRTFSKGMLQRAGICFALLHNPSIVILDEPMSGLDPLGRKMVFDLVAELRVEGKTIFFCSHILNDVERLCDRIGLMNKGRLVNEFGKEDFFQETGENLFLHTQLLSGGQREEMTKMGVRLRNFEAGHLLAIPALQYPLVSRYLEDSGVAIYSSRSEWISLEDLFMQALGEQIS